MSVSLDMYGDIDLANEKTTAVGDADVATYLCRRQLTAVDARRPSVLPATSLLLSTSTRLILQLSSLLSTLLLSRLLSTLLLMLMSWRLFSTTHLQASPISTQPRPTPLATSTPLKVFR